MNIQPTPILFWLCALLTASSVVAQTPTVTVIEAEAGQLETARETSVVIRPERVSEVTAQTAGSILSISKQQDMTVQAGEVVIDLDTQQQQLQLQNANLALSSARVSLANAETTSQSQQEQASLTVQSAEATYRNAQQQYAEGQELFQIGAISQVALNQLEADALSAEAALNRAQSTLTDTESGSGNLELLRLQVRQAQNQVAEARQALEATRVTSPLTGKITQMLVDPGAYVDRGTPLFRVATTNQQVAVLNVPLEVADRLSAAGSLSIPYGGATYDAQVLSVSALEPTTQLVELTARLTPSDDPMPNGTVTQFSYTFGGSGGLILPSDALRSEPGRRFVFLYQEGRAVRSNVEVIDEQDTQAAVLGIPIGAQVIYPIPANLQDGQAVVLSEEN